MQRLWWLYRHHRQLRQWCHPTVIGKEQTSSSGYRYLDGRPFDGHHLSVLSRQAWDKHERKFGRKEALVAVRHLFLSFPYVCPEPVLAK
jgi:hypothetical protein